MGAEIENFYKALDLRLKSYAEIHKNFIRCRLGCSSCCEKGDYPLSDIELQYVMRGYISLDNSVKRVVQENIKNMEKGGACPFLIDKKCCIYPYRPIICRVHGLAYLCGEKTVKVPYCVNENKNYSDVYDNGEININPIKENLDTPEILKTYYTAKNSSGFVIKNLYDWLNHSPGIPRTDS